MEYTVLIADDDPQTLKLLKCALATERYNIVTAMDGASVLLKAAKHSPDLIVLDIVMPGVNGYEACRLLKKNLKTRSIPLIMLSGQASEKQKIEGLNMGADDYVTKPFSPRELKARIKAVLRRHYCVGHPEEIIEYGGICINISKHRVSVGGKNIKLTSKEFDLLFHLMKNPGVLHKTKHILEEIWGYNESVNSKTLDVHISHLRKKVGKKASKRISNIYNLGYVFSEDEQ